MTANESCPSSSISLSVLTSVNDSSSTWPGSAPSFGTTVHFWWNQCGERPGGIRFLVFSLVLDLLLGLPSNCWVLGLILHRYRRSRGNSIPASELLSVNLACMEIIGVSFINTLFPINFYFWKYDLILGVMTFLSGLQLTGRPLMLCVVCLERYLAVLHPVTYLRYKATRYKVSCLLVVWLLTLALCVTLFVAEKLQVTATVFVPLLVIDSYCSVCILRALRRPPPGDKERLRRGEGGADEARREGKRDGEMEERGEGEKMAEEEGEYKREENESTEEKRGESPDEAPPQDPKRKMEETANKRKAIGKEEGEGGGMRWTDGGRSGKDETKKEEDRGRRVGGMKGSKRRAFVTVAVIQVMLLVTYSPIVLTLPFSPEVVGQCVFYCDLQPVATAFARMGSFIQPLLYLHREGKLTRRK